ncbi:MAG: hypothetical protein ACTSXP_04905, partial [Promethearchaeota archaeon]
MKKSVIDARIKDLVNFILTRTRAFTRIYITYMLSFLCFSIMLILFNRSGLSLSFEIWLSDGIEKVGVVTIPVNDVFSIIAFGPLL